MSKTPAVKEKKSALILARGMFHIVGPDNSGKSTFALTSHPDPAKICYLDGDSSKSKVFADQMGIGKYIDLTHLGKGMDELAYHKMVLDEIDKIEDNKYEVIVLDNGNEFFKSGWSYVSTNRADYRKKWNPRGDIAGAQEWNELRQTHFPRIYSDLKNKAPLVIICTPEKSQSDGGVKTGLTEPSADPSLRLAAEVIIRLAKNVTDEDAHAPVGLVIKNTMVYAGGRLQKVFPDRIVPCTWDKISYYLNNPLDTRKPTGIEVPNDFELRLIEGTLSPEQQEHFAYRKRMALLQADENLVNDILESSIKHKDKPSKMLSRVIHNELSAEAYPDLTLEKVELVLAETRETVTQNGKEK